jgi:bacterioferritin (cytochrome b1)
MALGKALYQSWQRIQEALIPDHHQQLLTLLRQQYGAEICGVAQLTLHAWRMHYPQFRERLLQLAHEDQAHVQWLREQILALGGDLPTVSCPPPRVGKNSWECLRLALEEKKRSCTTLLECIHQADRTDLALAAELRRRRAREKQHCDEIMDMMMKSDPDALGPPPLTSQQEQQRQAWLAQQKIA